jgi:hypothetical protein
MTHSVNRDNFIPAWLDAAPDHQFTTFFCTLLEEIDGSRAAIAGALGEAVFIHHNDPDTYKQKLAHLGFSATADALDRRPKARKTRLGNFGEILASEFLRQVRGYRIPVYRLRYNCNDESSPKGDDVLAFEFAEKGTRRRDAVIVAEVKVRSTYRSDVVDEAHDALRLGKRPRPKSFAFVVDVLFKEGKGDEAKRLLDLSHKFGRRSLTRRSCLFLITGNRPRGPFDGLAKLQVLAPNLEAVHLTLDRLAEFVASTFEVPIDARRL